MTNGRCNWARGKVIGGTSTINGMIYLRGNKKDYDRWEANGNTGWGYNNILKYFKKSEHMTAPELINSSYHGTDGYLTIEESKYRTKMADEFIKAGSEFGYKQTDLNGKSGTGFMISQGTVRNGRRCSTAKAFLRSARERSNLVMSLNSTVNRILINSKNHAYAVEFKRDGKIYQIKAKNEIIISAGAINSPHLLMLSGIGPENQLKTHGIPVISNLDVGKNLQDHIGYGGVAFTADIPLTFGDLPLSAIFDYELKGTGPLTTLNGLEVLALVKTKYANKTDDVADIEFMFNADFSNSDGQRIVHGVTNDINQAVYGSLLHKPSWSIIPFLLSPKSRGYIELRSANPRDYPLIYANYFDNEEDMRILIEGVRLAMMFGKTPTMQKFNSTIAAFDYPACRAFTPFSDNHIECMIRQYTFTIYHPVGTCKMGPATDPAAVVDPELRVYGVERLRVIDSSIIPELPRGHTNAATIMIGEKGADMIKDYWSLREFCQ